MGVNYDSDLRGKAKANGGKLVTIAVMGNVFQEAVPEATARKVLKFYLDLTEPAPEAKVAGKPLTKTLFDEEGTDADE